jgi:hypothetical protein
MMAAGLALLLVVGQVDEIVLVDTSTAPLTASEQTCLDDALFLETELGACEVREAGLARRLALRRAPPPAVPPAVSPASSGYSGLTVLVLVGGALVLGLALGAAAGASF